MEFLPNLCNNEVYSFHHLYKISNIRMQTIRICVPKSGMLQEQLSDIKTSHDQR